MKKNPLHQFNFSPRHVSVFLIMTTLTLFTISYSAFSQSVDVKDISAGDEETTIKIHKGKRSADTAPTEEKSKDRKWEITDGNSDIEGDTGATAKDAKTKWKTACDSWKKTFRTDNKENKIINLECGSPKCDGSAGNMVCKSTAVYKIKTKLD